MSEFENYVKELSERMKQKYSLIVWDKNGITVGEKNVEFEVVDASRLEVLAQLGRNDLELCEKGEKLADRESFVQELNKQIPDDKAYNEEAFDKALRQTRAKLDYDKWFSDKNNGNEAYWRKEILSELVGKKKISDKNSIRGWTAGERLKYAALKTAYGVGEFAQRVWFMNWNPEAEPVLPNLEYDMNKMTEEIFL